MVVPLAVDESRCNGCEICVSVCPFNAISMEDGLAKIHDNCTDCGVCIEECPEEAIYSVEEKEAEVEHRGILAYVTLDEGGPSQMTKVVLSQARRLASEIGARVTAILLTGELTGAAEELIYWGADTVLLGEDRRFEVYDSQLYSNILSKIAKEERPEIFLFGDDFYGRDLGPRVAQEVGTGMASGCSSLEIDYQRRLVQKVPIFEGKYAMTVLTPERRPQVASVLEGAVAPLERDETRRGEVRRIELDW